MTTPWCDRTDSVGRGFVAGSGAGSVLSIVILFLLAFITELPVFWPIIAVYAFSAALAAYMWFHG